MQDVVASAPPSPSALPETRTWLERLWSSIAERGRPYADVPSEGLPPLERARRLARSLLSERGEASGAAVARELHDAVCGLAGEDRLGFFRFLVEDFGPEPERLRKAAETWLATPTIEAAARLAEVAEAPRQELLRRMNLAPGGTHALVTLREELTGLTKSEPVLKVLDSDLRHLFASWFNRGFLELRRIDWQTPAAVLEKLIRYEAVHEIQGWEDLRRRLEADRRCFAFFHPSLPGEPLIFVEVALVKGMAEAVQPLLARDEPPGSAKDADTAIFYSISNCQEGLRGISFGNFLIKQVVEELKAELPQLTRFATLSPVPGFRRWLEHEIAGAPEGGLFRAEEATALGGTGPAEAFKAMTEGAWWTDEAKREALRAPLLRLAATYLTRPNSGTGGIDPVARFHLGNGARLERINFLGNTGGRGMRESYGVMVNYLYDREHIEANHERFVHSGQVVRSAGVDGLLNLPRLAPAAPSRSAFARLLGGEEKSPPRPN
ncbi:malonyl-CoA decarboxylase domain-containing protein [Paracraurococcus lichenis]|uniref:Malonyl-CoA decarboxylase family protein n=1 Tax=Paracraurococcus lichenis TaxID=3064888 RepID=A0ABT9E5S0_9PROT|nr:malonyl-CoA decarboxylase family protein [Paracraurococcus sp. LOR1-02]MDO9711512.1 malonyl-CoA decarboxylase family protein [Paracraurococcus sp. LOR1-02]